MSTYQPLICIVDDDVHHTAAMTKVLLHRKFRVETFENVNQFLESLNQKKTYDLVISDFHMPGANGFDLCRAVRARAERVRTPIILITGTNPSFDTATGLDAGADEFIAKPCNLRHLISKINSLLNIRREGEQMHSELIISKDLNQELGRFVSPNLANRLSEADRQKLLQPHRSEVTVLFTDLRRFTAFSEKVEPEEVMDVLRSYYEAVGTAAIRYQGTLGHLAGDGIMVFFNDPEPIEHHREVALKMALEAREALVIKKKLWDERYYDIDFGMGLAEGFATIGGIGFERFSQYSVIGTVTNFASRLCHQAQNGQILVSNRFLARLEPGFVNAEALGQAQLKGIVKPVALYNILNLKAG